ncbi:sporulation membrane protein YtaF [Wansuia hejianensis]|uniref:Sporulation membrane protein YtaF n=1 Tax=Wansuia hejianensis TaxID=2763667 RepID=A0A926IH50_9FIRM|nr:sporulation membrane protein YtaF [Wansuia hejianensis]MBC8590277.1 sporulation membrane protein YtaF [Wansuia hejianensis]
MEYILLVLTLSLDAFVASIAYGSKKIKIPFLSILTINLVCSLFLGLSIVLGSLFKRILPSSTASILSAAILIGLGVFYLFESIVKNILEKKSDSNKKLKLKISDIWFIIDIYVDETMADLDKSNRLEAKEAVYLATALSLDSIGIGFGSSLVNINYISIMILSVIVGVISIFSGLILGEKIAKISNINLSWLAGVMLIILGIFKLI